MQTTKFISLIAIVACLAGCSAFRGNGNPPQEADPRVLTTRNSADDDLDNPNRTTIWDIFNTDSQEQTVQVNRYMWSASLEVLSFLPIESVDPFTGVIVTGYGTPPGGGRAYRATVLIDDPALDARSLKVAMQTRNGPVSAATTRAVEDAILNRARQLRIADNRL